MPRRIEYTGGGHQLEAYRGLAAQCGLPLQDVLTLARNNALHELFDSRGLLRRVPDGNVATARRRLRDVEKRWAREEHRKRCPECQEIYAEDWSCFCTRPRGPAPELPPGTYSL